MTSVLVLPVLQSVAVTLNETIGIHASIYFDLGDSTWSRKNATELKAAQQVAVLRHSPLTLLHLDQDPRPVVTVSSEGLGLFGRDGGIPPD